MSTSCDDLLPMGVMSLYLGVMSLYVPRCDVPLYLPNYYDPLPRPLGMTTLYLGVMSRYL